MDLRSVERQLDFSDAGRAVTRFLANRNRRLFSMSTENALVTLLREGVSVQETDMDSKRDLEDALRSACNDFIDHTCASLLPSNANIGQMQETLPKDLETVVSQMSLYLDNAATQSILLKPVSRKLLRTVEEWKTSSGDNDTEALAQLETIIKQGLSTSATKAASTGTTSTAAATPSPAPSPAAPTASTNE